MAGVWNLKLTFGCMATTYELLHLEKRRFVQWKILGIPISFIWIIIFFNVAFEYGDDGNLKILRRTQNLHQNT
jgi:hypothetical protein